MLLFSMSLSIARLRIHFPFSSVHWIAAGNYETGCTYINDNYHFLLSRRTKPICSLNLVGVSVITYFIYLSITSYSSVWILFSGRLVCRSYPTASVWRCTGKKKSLSYDFQCFVWVFMFSFSRKKGGFLFEKNVLVRSFHPSVCKTVRRRKIQYWHAISQLQSLCEAL